MFNHKTLSPLLNVFALVASVAIIGCDSVDGEDNRDEQVQIEKENLKSVKAELNDSENPNKQFGIECRQTGGTFLPGDDDTGVCTWFYNSPGESTENNVPRMDLFNGALDPVFGAACELGPKLPGNNGGTLQDIHCCNFDDNGIPGECWHGGVWSCNAKGRCGKL